MSAWDYRQKVVNGKETYVCNTCNHKVLSQEVQNTRNILCEVAVKFSAFSFLPEGLTEEQWDAYHDLLSDLKGASRLYAEALKK